MPLGADHRHVPDDASAPTTTAAAAAVEKIHLPDGVEPVPVLFQQAGYYTCIGGLRRDGQGGLGKTDYNFEWDAKMYDGNDWAGRKPGQPFFMQVQLAGGKLRGGNDASASNWPSGRAQEFGDADRAART